MTYKETLDYMFNSLPMYHRIGKAAYKADITNTVSMMEHLGHPERHFKSIHVAGTNGKGSVSHFLASTLMRVEKDNATLKVGLYTSPHLVDFRERIRINGQMVPQDYVVKFIEQNRDFFESHDLSFFEMTVGMAFQYFADEQVDIAVVEVGMGGRLDSTNVITPELCVITNIGLDHTQFLGDTLAKEEQDTSSPFSISKTLGGVMIARAVQRQIGLVLLVCAFLIIYISNRYICQKKLVEIDKLETKLVDARFKATVCTSQLTEKSRESNIMGLLYNYGDSTLAIPQDPPYLIRVEE